MNEMIERVARDLCKKNGGNPDALRSNFLGGGSSWGKAWEEYVNEARASIEVARARIDSKIRAVNVRGAADALSL